MPDELRGGENNPVRDPSAAVGIPQARAQRFRGHGSICGMRRSVSDLYPSLPPERAFQSWLAAQAHTVLAFSPACTPQVQAPRSLIGRWPPAPNRRFTWRFLLILPLLSLFTCHLPAHPSIYPHPPCRFTWRFLFIFLSYLAFPFWDLLGWWSLPVLGTVTFLLAGIENVSNHIENPLV